MKKVDKYEFSINSTVCDGGIQTYVGINTETQQQHTIKKINLKQNHTDTYQSLFDQIKIMKKVSHPNILYCYKILQTARHYYIVYDLYHHKTLGDMLQTQLRSISIVQKISYVKQIIKGLKELHSHGIIHLQLNPHNIYITKQNQIKIGGFKYSATLSKQKNRISLDKTPPLSIFVPNEIKEYRIAFHNSDIYSLGKIIRTLNIDEFPDNKNLNVSQLIEKMIHSNPSNRMSLKQVQSIILQNKSLGAGSPMMTSQRSKFSQSKSTRISPFSPRQPMSPKIPFSPTGSITLKHKINKQRSQQIQPEKKIITKNSTQKQLSTIEQIPQQKPQATQKLHLQYLQTLKWRNLSIFLVQLASSCCRSSNTNLILIELSCLLIKKGVKIISMLYQYIQKIQKSTLMELFDEDKISNLQQIKKIKDIFKKQKESHTSKYKTLELIIEESKITTFSSESTSLDDLIKKKIEQFLQFENNFQNWEKQDLVNFYFLCQLLEYENCQSMFQMLANKNVITLSDQNFLTRIQKYTKNQLLKSIKLKSSKKI